MELSVRSGTSRSKRGGDGDLGGRRLKTSSMRSFAGFRRGVAWRSARGGGGGAAGHSGAARGRRGAWIHGSVGAAASAMAVRERGRETGEEWTCPLGRGHDVEDVQRVGRRSGEQVTPWRARARRRHHPACLAGTKQLAGSGQHSAGPPGGPAGGSGQVSPFLIFVFFSISFVTL